MSNEARKIGASKYHNTIKTTARRLLNRVLEFMSVVLCELLYIYEREVEKSNDKIEKAVAFGKYKATLNIIERFEFAVPGFKRIPKSQLKRGQSHQRVEL